MSMTAGIGRAVTEFVRRHARSAEEWHLLLAMMDGPERWWDATSASAEAGISVSAARRALEHFAAGNLLEIRITGDVRYQFRPGTPELAEAARATAEAFRRDPLAMLALLPPQRTNAIRDFAEAFRLRRDGQE